MSEQEVIIELAKKYLNETGQNDVEERLADNKLPIAKLFVLSAIESLRIKGDITEDEATNVFQKLGIVGQRITPTARRGSPRW